MTSFILPLDKPIGPTSHDMVAIARRALGTKRVGHTGTLDPFASGLLLLCIGNATRLAEYLVGLPKTYHAAARFDGATSSDDVTGDRLSLSDGWRSLAMEAVQAAFDQQRGTIWQRPSAVSAKKISGERAYERARRGDAVELAASQVTIYDIRLVDVTLPDVRFEIDCSAGTYVRALARDVGVLLGTGGYLTELRRTRIGHFRVEDAVTSDQLHNAEAVARHRVPMLNALSHMERLEVTEDEERALRFGQAIERAGAAGTMVMTRDADVIAIGVSDDGTIRPKKVFPRD